MKKSNAFLSMACCALVGAADQTIGWPPGYQADLARHVSATEPPSVEGPGPSDVVSHARHCRATPGYGSGALTFESVWRSVSATEALPGIDLGRPGFLLFLR